MQRDAKRAAITAYKERKASAGIFAVRCSVNGACWVGRAPDLSAMQRRLWFTLGHGSHPHAALQAAWRVHGADTFAFEIAEKIDVDEVPEGYLRDGLLKDRLTHWKAELGATSI